MKKTATKRKLVLGREVVKTLSELRDAQLVEAKGGLMAGTRIGCTGCTDLDSGCGIVTR